MRVPGPARYVPIDESLTESTPEPAAPVPLCVDPDGAAVLCDTQLALWVQWLRAALASANADKAGIREISRQTAEAQRE